MKIELFTLLAKPLFWELEMLNLSSVPPLCDQYTFYSRFHKDIRRARTRVLIESPFMTTRRVSELLPVLNRLHQKGVRIIVNTKPIEEHDDIMASQQSKP